MNPIRLLLVDDHEVVRVGLRSMLERREDLAVVGEAAGVAEAVRVAAETQPDVVIMDVRLPDGSGVEACREIRSRRPETQVIMLTSYSDDKALFDSIMAGAAGYLLKQTRSRALVEAIKTVAAGGSLLDPAVTRKVLDRVRHGAASGGVGSEGNRPGPGTAGAAGPLDSLTGQERRILELIAEGLTNREIGEKVHLSEKTVKHYVSNILAKLEVARRTEAATLFAREKAREEKE